MLIYLVCFLFACEVEGQQRIHIQIPTPQSETDYVWRTLQGTLFFEANNYQVSLPPGPLIDSLKAKARDARLSDADYEALGAYMRDSVYHKEDYQKGYQQISSTLPQLNKLFAQIDTSQLNWSFKQFDTYQVNLTLYGPGGSYDPDEGSILIYTTPDGRFKQYDNPLYTLIHEIVHIGIETSIIQQYQVPHALKERIVDQMVLLYFQEELPGYRIQNMGDTRIDPFVKSKEDFRELHTIVATIMQN